MDTSLHTLQALFLQLGLANGAENIQSFLRDHRGLPPDLPLAQADFWAPSQAAFLREAIENDSDWCEVVDEFDNLLRG